MTPFDTIVAPATPLGRSALAIVRMDGPGSTEILRVLLKDGLPAIRTATLARLPGIDECVVVRYEAPHSFTGNDLVELSLHGNPLIVSRVVAACVAEGARIAEPGEFTERAVLNGKMDLVQAESIGDLINARTTLQAKLSLANVEGALSRKASGVRQVLLDVISRLEAALDFSEEGYEFISRDEALAKVREAHSAVTAMEETYRRGSATRSGLEAVILGRPNAGKSTLLNRLVGTDRAIVTPIPGTTRDILRETIEIGGLPVTLADTAGLRESADVVEGIGVVRARQAAQSADLVLYLVPSDEGLTDEDRAELAVLPHAQVVYTKADLANVPPGALSVSAVSEPGVGALLQHLDSFVQNTFAAAEGSLVNERQRLAVVECGEALLVSATSLAAGLDEQVVLVDLYRAANALGILVGAVTREDVLARIFSQFCIGK